MRKLKNIHVPIFLVREWQYLIDRIPDFWPNKTEPGELITSIALFIVVSCVTHAALVGSIHTPMAFKLMDYRIREAFSMIGAFIFCVHLVGMYRQKPLLRVVMQGIGTGFLLDYGTRAVVFSPLNPGGYFALLLAVVAGITWGVLVKKKWKFNLGNAYRGND